MSETGVRAFDRLAGRARELDAPLRNFVRSWSRLSDDDKLALFDKLIEAAHMPDAGDEEEPPPRLKQKHPVKRYDPEEVAATLPKKPRARPAPRKKSRKKTE
ncbi:MAG TPA: hypothetical protein VM779_07845 [Thermoanaerobaculia bacterium]|nr:hypothetical protein [Thermoanaerobaculia bacterium]